MNEPARVQTLTNGIDLTSHEAIPIAMTVYYSIGGGQFAGGAAMNVRKMASTFVCLDTLPPELRERVKTAIELMSRG